MELNSLSREQNAPMDWAAQTARKTLFRNVYLWMTFALIITGLTAFVAASTPSIVSMIFSSRYVFYGLLLGELALVWYLSSRINKLSITTATMFFIIYSVANGLTLSLIFIVYTSSSIALTFFVTAATFGVMAIIGTLTKRDLSSWGSILIMALVGIIIASIANWFLKSEMLYWIVTYAGVLIFVGLTIYDANKIKRLIDQHGYEVNETTQKIALMGALSLYLDFINLFLFLLRILGGRK